MTIFRSKRNKLLYTITQHMGVCGYFKTATPFLHNIPAFPRKKNISLDNFIAVATYK